MNTYACLSMLLICSWPLAAQVPDAYRYEIFYSGRTLGYARIPAEQPLIAPSGAMSQSDAAKAYLEQFSTASNDSVLQLRLGMGDNLAPELGGRTFDISGHVIPRCDGKTFFPPSIHLSKDLFNYEGPIDSGTLKLWCNDDAKYDVKTPFFDNVAEFFVTAKYDALIPGKLDFYPGAQYLRQIAEFLERNHVRMLGGNLIVTTSVPPGTMNAHPRIPDKFENDCHDNTGPHECYHTDFGAASVGIPGNVLPWKQQFAVSGARQAINAESGELFRADELSPHQTTAHKYQDLLDEDNTEIDVEPGFYTSSDPSKVLVPGHRRLPLAAADKICVAPPPHLKATCGALAKSLTGVSSSVVFLFRDEGDHLIPGLNHMFCTYLTKDPKHVRTCQPFSVQVPLFDSTPPYALVNRNNQKVAVFGVVDPDLLSNVGMLNTSWLNHDRGWNTQAQVISPDSALQQALEACAANEDCQNAPKVLMAQMSYARASQLISTSFATTFDAVLTQASPEHDTGNVGITYSGSKPRFILTPPLQTGTESAPGSAKGQTVDIKTFTPELYEAIIEKKPASNWQMTNVTPGKPAVLTRNPSICQATEDSCIDLARLSTKWLKTQDAEGSVQATPTTNPGAGQAFQQAVLMAMRKRVHADAAMVQTRDLYDADNLSYQAIGLSEVQDQVNRVLWKGDFVVVLHVTGGTIRKLLAQSAAFAAQDGNSLSTEIEKGRDLITLGIYADPKNPANYYINGAMMSDTTLYTIAATDFVVGGDTGYSILASPDVPPVLRLEDFAQDKVRPIAGMVCKVLVGQYAGLIAGEKECADMGLAPEYFDTSDGRPFDKTPGFDTTQHWRGFLKNFAEPQRPFSNAEQSIQQRAFWSLSLENLDFNESGLFINHLAKTTASLGGISNPLVTSTGSSNIGADHKARFVYDYHWGTNYLLSDSNFLRNSTTASGPSLADNVVGTEAGGTVRLGFPPSTKALKQEPGPLERPAWLSFQYSVRYERELINPVDTPETLNGGLTALLPTPKISTLYGKLGMRAELGNTYLETGFEMINSRGLLEQYQITPAGGSVLYCQPGANTPLLCGPDKALNNALDTTPVAQETALSAASLATKLTQTNYLVPGAYLNFFWKFPIWSRMDGSRTDQSWYFTLTNKGDLYFNTSSDTAVQTRYLDKFTPALNIPIWGNISLTPKVDFILYENKVNRNHYRAISPSISISYTFSLRQGMAWTRGLAYGAQTTTVNSGQ